VGSPWTRLISFKLFFFCFFVFELIWLWSVFKIFHHQINKYRRERFEERLYTDACGGVPSAIRQHGGIIKEKIFFLLLFSFFFFFSKFTSHSTHNTGENFTITHGSGGGGGTESWATRTSSPRPKKKHDAETDWFGGYIYFMGKRVWLFFFFFFISCMSDASSDCTSCACLDIRVAPLRLAQQPFSF
jgi:hypothetical protein